MLATLARATIVHTACRVVRGGSRRPLVAATRCWISQSSSSSGDPPIQVDVPISVASESTVPTPLAGAAAALGNKIGGKLRSEGHPTTAPKGTSPLGTQDRQQAPIQELILRDHTAVRLLHEKYLSAIDADTKRDLVYTLIYEICRHGSCEELVLYPALRGSRFPDGDRLADESIADHTEIMVDLKALDRTIAIGNPEFERRLTKMTNEFMEHGAKEERNVLPMMVKVMSPGELLRLGERFEAASAVVTSRPHPLVPREGLAGTVSHMLSKPLDMMRDQLEGRAAIVKEGAANVEAEAKRVLKDNKGAGATAH